MTTFWNCRNQTSMAHACHLWIWCNCICLRRSSFRTNSLSTWQISLYQVDIANDSWLLQILLVWSSKALHTNGTLCFCKNLRKDCHMCQYCQSWWRLAVDFIKTADIFPTGFIFCSIQLKGKFLLTLCYPVVTNIYINVYCCLYRTIS